MSRFISLFQQKKNVTSFDHQEIVEKWQPFYIKRKKLNSELQEYTATHRDAPLSERNVFAEKFARKLNFQIEKVQYFATTEAGYVAKLLNGHLKKVKEELSRISDSTLKKYFDGEDLESKLNKVRDYHEEFVQVAREVNQFMEYIDWNVRSIHIIRKNVTRYLGSDVVMMRELDEIDLLKVFQQTDYSPWDTRIITRAINSTISLTNFSTTEDLLRGRIKSSNEIAWSSARFHLQTLERSDHVRSILGFIHTIARVLDRLQVAEEGLLIKISEHNHAPKKPGELKRRGDRYVKDMIMLKNYIVSRADSFRRLISAEAEIFIDTKAESREEIERKNRLPVSNIVLNLMNTFLYIVSMYAPLSTAGQYAHSLGASEALFGIIIGGTPFAGFFSAILWAYLASFRIKEPLAASSLICLLGNVIYASAASFDSIVIAVLGRFMVGIGGARAINRQYIADNIPKSEQTMQSYYFVIASAVGMPFGPILALFANLPPNFKFMGLYFNNYTNAAWALVVIWSIYIFVLLKYFIEPVKEEKLNMAETDVSDSGYESEYQPLIGVQDEEKQKFNIFEQVYTIWTSRKILFMLALYVTIKLVNEVALTGAAFYLPHIYNWSSVSTSVYLAVLGFLVILITPIIKSLIKAEGKNGDIKILTASVLGGAVMSFTSLPFFEKAQAGIQFLILVVAATMIFIFMSSSESCAMSIIATIRPSALKKGVFNTSTLTTQSGLVGRALSGYLIYSVAPKSMEGNKIFSIVERRQFFTGLFLPCFIFCAFGITGIILLRDELTDADGPYNMAGDMAHVQWSRDYMDLPDETDNSENE